MIYKCDIHFEYPLDDPAIIEYNIFFVLIEPEFVMAL